jgi:hypothetical protein
VRVTGDREVAYTALLARLAESPHAPVPTRRILAAESAVIATRFGGSTAAYRAAISRAGATLSVARGVLADELRRIEIEGRLRARPPSLAEVSTFYFSYPELLVRVVEADPAPWWLAGRTTGLAFDALAPPGLFELPTGRRATFRGLEGTYTVRALGDTQPLGLVLLEQARAGISAVLGAFARREALESWTLARQTALLREGTCRADELPTPGSVGLAAYLPFLARV